MALVCITGGKECDGCGRCTEIEKQAGESAYPEHCCPYCGSLDISPEGWCRACWHDVEKASKYNRYKETE